MPKARRQRVSNRDGSQNQNEYSIIIRQLVYSTLRNLERKKCVRNKIWKAVFDRIRFTVSRSLVKFSIISKIRNQAVSALRRAVCVDIAHARH